MTETILLLIAAFCYGVATGLHLSKRRVKQWVAEAVDKEHKV